MAIFFAEFAQESLKRHAMASVLVKGPPFAYELPRLFHSVSTNCPVSLSDVVPVTSFIQRSQSFLLCHC